MLKVRKSEERGLGDHGWLKSRHSFSFANYYDPEQMGFRSLRVINEDRIAGGTGFGKHPHNDMEIISYVVKGALEHEDTMGNKTIIRPGEIQRLTAGTGMAHSEYNHDKKDETHFFQIWIEPNKRGMAPGYGQMSIEKRLQAEKFILVISGDGRDGSIDIAQDADLYIGRLAKAESITFTAKPDRHFWVQVVRGEIKVNDKILGAGDGLAAEQVNELEISSNSDSEFMLFDLA
jgi:redox-sensitive bicupin YhaK (pirin superfamily)